MSVDAPRPSGDPAADARVGTVIAGRYRLERVLGTGGMGAVFAATHVVTDGQVALKLLHPWVAAMAPGAKERLLEEARAITRVRHPAVVQVFDAGVTEDGAPFLVMELLDGETLAQALARGALRQGELLDVVLDVLDVLSLAHAAGIIHRDIKPENVFVQWRDGRAVGRLLDFGIARRSDRDVQNLTQVGAMLGTPFYMSPEQLLGEPLDGRADLYAVGTLLYRALSGRLPYASSQLTALLREVVSREPDSLAVVRPDLPPALVALVDRALRRDRDARWPDARRMRDALSPFSTRALELAEGTFREGALLGEHAAGSAAPSPVAPLEAPSAPEPALASRADAGPSDTVWRPSLLPPRPAKELDRRFVAAIGELEAEIADLRARHGASAPAPSRPPARASDAAAPAKRGWFDKVLKR